jgi:hypothetical protein
MGLVGGGVGGGPPLRRRTWHDGGVSEASEAFLYGEQVSEWFRRSAGVFESLSANCGIIESVFTSEPAANLAAAKRLSSHIRDAELLLLADPCPDLWGARQLNSIVATLAEAGHEIILAFGDPQGAERTMLQAKLASARRMITELQRLGTRMLTDESV